MQQLPAILKLAEFFLSSIDTQGPHLRKPEPTAVETTGCSGSRSLFEECEESIPAQKLVYLLFGILIGLLIPILVDLIRCI